MQKKWFALLLFGVAVLAVAIRSDGSANIKKLTGDELLGIRGGECWEDGTEYCITTEELCDEKSCSGVGSDSCEDGEEELRVLSETYPKVTSDPAGKKEYEESDFDCFEEWHCLAAGCQLIGGRYRCQPCNESYCQSYGGPAPVKQSWKKGDDCDSTP